MLWSNCEVSFAIVAASLACTVQAASSCRNDNVCRVSDSSVTRVGVFDGGMPIHFLGAVGLHVGAHGVSACCNSVASSCCVSCDGRGVLLSLLPV